MKGLEFRFTVGHEVWRLNLTHDTWISPDGTHLSDRQMVILFPRVRDEGMKRYAASKQTETRAIFSTNGDSAADARLRAQNLLKQELEAGDCPNGCHIDSKEWTARISKHCVHHAKLAGKAYGA